jgi:glycosyltransferase involved in cell wall biosynthesis
MKVLFLSTKYGVGKSGTSAYSHRLDKLCDALQARGVETDYIGLRDFPFHRPVLLQPLNLPLLRKRVDDYDFIHAGQDAAYIAGLWKPFTRARIIFDNHGDTFGEMHLECLADQSTRTAYWLTQAMLINAVGYRAATHYLVVSRPMQQWLMDEWHISAQHISLIRNGVDLELFQPLPPGSPDAFTVCYAGGFHPWQGVENVVRAFELLASTTPATLRLKIIGFTPEFADLKARIASRLGERAILVDRVPREELINHLADAHILVIPRSHHRAVRVALPTKFAEYVAMSKPVLVSDVDETADLVRTHRCGLVSEPTPSALAEQIRHAADLSRADLQEMGERGRHLAQQEFSWDVIGEKYGDLLTHRIDAP